MSPSGDDALVDVLRRSHELGFIGDADLDRHRRHARAFAEVVGPEPRLALDLGSGGGLPGLVLARSWPAAELVLLDGSATRAGFLREAVTVLGVDQRVQVVAERAEVAGRSPRWRGAFDVVVARSFGGPAVVAECAAPFLEVGGRLVVSEPPDASNRWVHPEELAQLGLQVEPDPVRTDVGTFRRLAMIAPCPDRFPRRVGIPAKRPLF